MLNRRAYKLRANLSEVDLPHSDPDHNYREPPPLRSELFSNEQMFQYGKALAKSHTLGSGRRPERQLPSLAENRKVLLEVRSLLIGAVKKNGRIPPAGEWLLDNFYLIEEQSRMAEKHLPKVYSRELPRLADGPSAGRPQVYDLALETFSHGDGRVDAGSLSTTWMHLRRC